MLRHNSRFQTWNIYDLLTLHSIKELVVDNPRESSLTMLINLLFACIPIKPTKYDSNIHENPFWFSLFIPNYIAFFKKYSILLQKSTLNYSKRKYEEWWEVKYSSELWWMRCLHRTMIPLYVITRSLRIPVTLPSTVLTEFGLT